MATQTQISQQDRDMIRQHNVAQATRQAAWSQLSRKEREAAFAMVRAQKGRATVCLDEMLQAHREIAKR